MYIDVCTMVCLMMGYHRYIYIYTGAKYVLCNEVSWCIIAPEAVKSAAIQLSSKTRAEFCSPCSC